MQIVLKIKNPCCEYSIRNNEGNIFELKKIKK